MIFCEREGCWLLVREFSRVLNSHAGIFALYENTIICILNPLLSPAEIDVTSVPVPESLVVAVAAHKDSYLSRAGLSYWNTTLVCTELSQQLLDCLAWNFMVTRRWILLTWSCDFSSNTTMKLTLLISIYNTNNISTSMVISAMKICRRKVVSAYPDSNTEYISIRGLRYFFPVSPGLSLSQFYKFFPSWGAELDTDR